jgi:CRP/FNR family transcriptional regulator, cyclic AMP receptor protein
MPPPSTIRLFEAEPELVRFLSAEDRAEAGRTELPVSTLESGEVDVEELFRRTGAFGAFVLDGMLLQSVRLGDHVGLRLLGPGDVLSLTEAPQSVLVTDSSLRATAPTRIVLLGRELLLAAHRWPRIVAGLQVRTGEQTERLVTQLMICQLSRVDERLLSVMWLLAESWGFVTAAGTMLPVSLTHEALGGLIGARRPTVTLALGELTDAGSILRQDRGWLLLRRPTAALTMEPGRTDEPRPFAYEPSQWTAQAEPPSHAGPARAALKEAVARLREEHLRSADQLRDRLHRIAETREQVVARRQRVALSRRRVPSK